MEAFISAIVSRLIAWLCAARFSGIIGVVIVLASDATGKKNNKIVYNL